MVAWEGQTITQILAAAISFSDNPKKVKEGKKLKCVLLADQLKQFTKRITLILDNLRRELRRETICHSCKKQNIGRGIVERNFQGCKNGRNREIRKACES